MAHRQAFLKRSCWLFPDSTNFLAFGSSFIALSLLVFLFRLYGSLLPVSCLMSRSRFVPKSAETAVGLNSLFRSLMFSAIHLNLKAGLVVAIYVSAIALDRRHEAHSASTFKIQSLVQAFVASANSRNTIYGSFALTTPLATSTPCVSSFNATDTSSP